MKFKIQTKCIQFFDRFYNTYFFNFSDENKGYTNLGGITVAIEDPDEEPQIEKPEECVYYNNLSVAKDIPVSDLLYIITTKQAKENEGFQKEFKVNSFLPPTQTRLSKKFTTRETLSKGSKTSILFVICV